MVRGVSRNVEPCLPEVGAIPMVIDGMPVVLYPLGLACCAVEVASGIAALFAEGAADGNHRSTDPPLHVLVVAGTVTTAMAAEVRSIWAGLGEPKAAVAFGVCTISGGPYWDSYAVAPGLADIVEADIYVTGCPPGPGALRDAVRAATVQCSAPASRVPTHSAEATVGTAHDPASG